MDVKTGFAEAIVALYNALQTRNNCLACGGDGKQWVDIGESEVIEPCDECVPMAEFALREYEPQYRAAVDRYLGERGYDPDKVAERIRGLEITRIMCRRR